MTLVKKPQRVFSFGKNASLVIKAFSNQHSDLENKVDYSCDKMIYFKQMKMKRRRKKKKIKQAKKKKKIKMI